MENLQNPLAQTPSSKGLRPQLKRKNKYKLKNRIIMKAKLPAVQILSCTELELHFKRPLLKDMIHIKGSKEVNKTIRNYIDLKRISHKEFFWLMLLSSANRVVGISEISSGGLDGVHINLKEIFQLVLLTNASGFVVIHNHPSGNLKPSQSDIKVTRKIQELGKLIDTKLIDHLIVTQEGYYSLSDHHQL